MWLENILMDDLLLGLLLGLLDGLLYGMYDIQKSKSPPLILYGLC